MRQQPRGPRHSRNGERRAMIRGRRLVTLCPRHSGRALMDVNPRALIQPCRCVAGPAGALWGKRSPGAEAQIMPGANAGFSVPSRGACKPEAPRSAACSPHGRIDAGAVAVVEGNRRLTFAELNERVNRLAHVLANEGIRRGDRVGILARNCAAWLELELAAAKLGAIVAAQNWRLAAPELRHCIRLAAPRAMLVAEDYAAMLAGLDVAVPLTITLGDDYETPGARRSRRTAGRRRAGGCSGDPLHQRHDRSAEGRRGQPPRVHRPCPGVRDRARPGSGRGVRRVAAVLPHGLDRPRARQPAQGQPRDRGRRLRCRRWRPHRRASASAGCRWCPA